MMPPRPSYHRSSVYVDNLRFSGLLEADRYCELKQKMQAGELWFLRQVAFAIAPGTAYRCNFMVVVRSDGRDQVHLEDVYGNDPVVVDKRLRVRKIYAIDAVALARENVARIVTESGAYSYES